MTWILINCFYYTFWMKEKDLSRFGIDKRNFDTILAHMDLLKQKKDAHKEQHSVPYDIYTIPEFDVQEHNDKSTISNMKMTRSCTCVNLLAI